MGEGGEGGRKASRGHRFLERPPSRSLLITDDGQEATVGGNEMPQTLLQARPAFRRPGKRAVREGLNAALKPRVFFFFAPRRGAGDWEQRSRMSRSSIQQLKLPTRCARSCKLGHQARECSEGSRGNRHDKSPVGRRGVLGKTRKGSSRQRGKRSRDLSFLGPHGHSWPLILKKFCGIPVLKKDSSDDID